MQYNLLEVTNMSATAAIRIRASLVDEATRYAKLNFRSVPKQLEYWITIGRCAEDNPDLPYEFIKESLLAKEEIANGETIPFVFRE